MHICCGVCATSAVERLRGDGFKPIGFFYNPNIYPEAEYLRRLATAQETAHILEFKLIKGCYEKNNWFKLTRGLENEPEGARRCSVCFKMRLEATQSKAARMKISKFSTTLTNSPHKYAAAVNDTGRAISASGFLECDFKKQDGFRLAIEFAKRYNLYRQNYCGCMYSYPKNCI